MRNLIVLTQRITRTGPGRVLILLAVLIASLHAAHLIDAVPNQDGMPPVDCPHLAAQLDDVTTTTVADRPCP